MHRKGIFDKMCASLRGDAENALGFRTLRMRMGILARHARSFASG